MQRMHTSTVTPDQIDHLGHMNVRYYGVNASAATNALFDQLGINASQVDVGDLYTRHHHEQLVGAELHVETGIAHADSDGLRIYHELRNSDDQIAATFVYGVAAHTPLADDMVARAIELVVPIPAHGAPRSIVLDAPSAPGPKLEEVQQRELAMRLPRAVDAGECDEQGNYQRADAPHLTWSGEPIDGDNHPHLHDGPNGEKMGWAVVETRLRIHRLPRVGDQIQSFAAVVDLGDKVTHRVQWSYDLTAGDVLVSFEVINLAFDTMTRRAMTIPPNLRANEERVLQPDLKPGHT